MTTSNTVCPNCDECGSELLDVVCGEEEIYCPICDVGDDVELDGSGDIKHCEDCITPLATWYPFSSCPSCLSPKENTTKH
jgi:hypothetical protein